MGLERWLYTLPLRLRTLFRRGEIEQELDEELRYHLEQYEVSAAGKVTTAARDSASRTTRRH
jgi:hypothetical protein